MTSLNKITILLISFIFFAFVILYLVKIGNAVEKTGIINSLTIRKVHRIENSFKIYLESTEQIEFKFDEISPFFDVKRSLDLRPGNRIAYLLSKKNEVLSLRNMENDRQISSAFYVFNLLVSNGFVYIIILLLAGMQFAYTVYNYKFMVQGTKKHAKVFSTVDKINQFIKRNVVLIPLFFLLFFFLLYQFSANFNALVEPISGLSIQKYVLNFIIFLWLIIFLSINMYLEKKSTHIMNRDSG